MMCPICDAFVDDEDVWCPECDSFLDEEFFYDDEDLLVDNEEHY
jgi:RNA polymerase subunit RPABC4/transcription elongation factor Spt4